MERQDYLGTKPRAYAFVWIEWVDGLVMGWVSSGGRVDGLRMGRGWGGDEVGMVWS